MKYCFGYISQTKISRPLFIYVFFRNTSLSILNLLWAQYSKEVKKVQANIYSHKKDTLPGLHFSQ